MVNDREHDDLHRRFGIGRRSTAEFDRIQTTNRRHGSWKHQTVKRYLAESCIAGDAAVKFTIRPIVSQIWCIFTAGTSSVSDLCRLGTYCSRCHRRSFSALRPQSLTRLGELPSHRYLSKSTSSSHSHMFAQSPPWLPHLEQTLSMPLMIDVPISKKQSNPAICSVSFSNDVRLLDSAPNLATLF